MQRRSGGLRTFEALVRALPPSVPVELASYLGSLTLLPEEWTPPTPVDMGKSLNWERATVFRKFRAAGLRPPQEMVGWIRVYLVFCLVEEGMPVERATMSVGYGSVGNFRSMAAGRLGVPQSEVPSVMARGLREVLERLAAVLRSEVA